MIFLALVLMCLSTIKLFFQNGFCLGSWSPLAAVFRSAFAGTGFVVSDLPESRTRWIARPISDRVVQDFPKVGLEFRKVGIQQC